MRKIISLFVMIIFTVTSSQIPTLRIVDEKSHPVILQNVKFETEIFGNLATTTATYTFYNPSDRILEGTLTFPLPDGVRVSGYALDINGKMRKAVPVPKERAKEVFESIEKRNIDPGLVEMVQGNNFRTRIYPIPNKGSRTIQVSYHQELKSLHSQYQYFLSFADAKTIPKFELKVVINDDSSVPKILETPIDHFSFQKSGNRWIAETSKDYFSPNKNLKISIPKSKESASVLREKASDGKVYFSAAIASDFMAPDKPSSRKIAIIWDNSFSGSKRNLNKEIEFLNTYFSDNKNVSVTLVALNNTFEKSGDFTVHQGDWTALKNKILSFTYDGGTDFGALKEISNIDEYLLFSDGISNFGEIKIKFKKPVNSISSTATSDFTLLKCLSGQSGGNFINLNELDVLTALKIYKKMPVTFLGFKENTSIQDVVPNRGSVVNEPITIFGIAAGKIEKLTAIFAVANKKTEIRVDIANASEAKNEQIASFWAQRKIDELELNSIQNKDKIRTIGEQFGIVSKNTSLVVLENMEDYIRYHISPPQELQAEYKKITSKNKKNILEQRKDLLSKAFEKTKELKNWWDKEFKLFEKKEDSTIRRYRSTPDKNISNNPVAEIHIAGVEVIASKPSAPNGKITLVSVESNAEYMKDFQNLQTSDLVYAQYLKKRGENERLPSYYFDISKLLFEKGDKVRSLKVLSTLAALGLENEELYKTIMYLLKQRGYYDKELWIAKKILEWRPFDIQSHRDYALALVDNKRDQEALDVYKSMFYQEFSNDLSVRDKGIEEVLIMEMNNILSLNKNIDARKIDDRLKADLPVDIRVVMNWNKDNTDIDLWITDPIGEDCSYSNTSTQMGGRLSNDFKQGFGPEQFLLKNAIKGKYKIKTNFFGERQNLLSGPTTIMAEIYLYYSDGRQERKIVVFQSKKENKKEKDSKILIGEFDF